MWLWGGVRCWMLDVGCWMFSDGFVRLSKVRGSRFRVRCSGTLSMLDVGCSPAPRPPASPDTRRTLPVAPLIADQRCYGECPASIRRVPARPARESSSQCRAAKVESTLCRCPALPSIITLTATATITAHAALAHLPALFVPRCHQNPILAHPRFSNEPLNQRPDPALHPHDHHRRPITAPST